MNKYMQKIYFGPPGCGKSFYVRKVAIEELKIATSPEALKKSPNMIEATFHPEYGYGDFVAKLLPKTKPDGGIEYRIHAGPLIRALARAYADEAQNVLLVIDEINRGNCAQIFGDIFQLLDRKDDGWSEYGVDISDLTKGALEQELNKLGRKLEDLAPELVVEDTRKKEKTYKLLLPPTFSLIGTMNTSDESVYYMDTAFKRRWDFKFMPWNGEDCAPAWQKEAVIEGTKHIWDRFLNNLNDFIAHEFKGRSVDDKQVGIWFLKTSYCVTFPDVGSVSVTKGKLKRISEFEEQLAILSDNACTDNAKKAWKKCFPTAKSNTGTDLAGSITYENHEPIGKDLKEIYGFAFPESFYANVGVAVFADKLLKERRGHTKIARDAIQNKLMFFLWDNVFSRDRKPLYALLANDDSKKAEPRTFGAFSGEVDAFIKGVMEWKVSEASGISE